MIKEFVRQQTANASLLLLERQLDKVDALLEEWNKAKADLLAQQRSTLPSQLAKYSSAAEIPVTVSKELSRPAFDLVVTYQRKLDKILLSRRARIATVFLNTEDYFALLQALNIYRQITGIYPEVMLIINEYFSSRNYQSIDYLSTYAENAKLIEE